MNIFLVTLAQRRVAPPKSKSSVTDTIRGLANWSKYKARDGERAPMQWNDTGNAGFTTATPRLPIPSNASNINVRAEENEPDSLLGWHRAPIRLKKIAPALERGSKRMLDTKNAKVLS